MDSLETSFSEEPLLAVCDVEFNIKVLRAPLRSLHCRTEDPSLAYNSIVG